MLVGAPKAIPLQVVGIGFVHVRVIHNRPRLGELVVADLWIVWKNEVRSD